jgi:pimeloyl-ACP methyl ester carboxylesterase
MRVVSVATSAVVFLFLIVVGGFAQGTGDLPQIVDEAGNPLPNAVVSLEKLNLGGIGQWVLIRGRDRNKPVLLVLHGGPGASMMPWVDLFHTTELESSFVVVHWDQRGAGKSFSSGLTTEDLDVASYVDDTLELADLLRRRFGKNRIFLTGVSWGSALGFLTLQRDSSPFHAFIATSERVAWRRSQTLGYEWVKAEAEKAGDQDALERLAAIEPFDPADFGDIAVKNELLDTFGGGDIHTEGLWDAYQDYATSGQSPYYTPAEVGNYPQGLEFSQRAVIPQALDYNLFEDYPKSPIPVHFIMGMEDHQTPVSIVEDYAGELDAPDKSLTIVQSAGHDVPFDAPLAWAKALIRIAGETAEQH